MTATDLLFAGIGFIILALEGVAALLIVWGGALAIGVLVRGRDPSTRATP